jgi:hypothetical protein
MISYRLRLPLVTGVAFVALSTGVSGGQLEVKSRTAVRGTAGHSTFAFSGAPLCDSRGNLFVRPLAGPSLEVPSIWRISADGNDVAYLRPQDVSGLERAGIQDIALGSDGQAHVLVGLARNEERSEQYIVSFDQKGQNRSKPVLIRDVWARSIAAFDSGRYLVAGSTKTSGSTLLVLSGGGRLVGPVQPPEDPASRPLEEREAADAWSAHGWKNLAELTMAQPTENDQVVVVRPTLRGPVYRISSSGEVVQHFALNPPFGASGLLTMKASGSRLALLYKLDAKEDGRARFAIQVVDMTGAPLAEYENPFGVFACYGTGGVSDVFTFLRPEEDGLVIAQAREP